MENDNDKKNMQQLAETGWKQMHEMLRQQGLSVDDGDLAPAYEKRNLFPLLAACVFLILIFSFPYILNDKILDDATYSSVVSKSNTAASSFSKKKTIISPSGKNISAAQQAPFNLKKRNIFVPKSKAEVAATEKNKPVASKLFEEEVYSQRAFAQEIPLALFSKQEFKSDTILNTASHFLFKQKKPENTVSKKAQFFAGAGINIATGNMNSNSFFDGINIHPGFTVAIPLTKKLSLHSGLWAFSSVHGKEVSSKERELVNNINSNLYYNINTTTIIKASYFDVPVTLHYSIHKNWSVGSGLQLSRLYKISIREQKESFDYNNTLFSATVDQFNATPARAAIAFPRKVEINKFEPRFVAETNLQQGKWLFSAGYYYGLGKSVTLKETDNTRHQYRNEYFKLGMHYRIF